MNPDRKTGDSLTEEAQYKSEAQGMTAEQLDQAIRDIEAEFDTLPPIRISKDQDLIKRSALNRRLGVLRGVLRARVRKNYEEQDMK